MGRRIVITTFGSLGDIHPYVALASGLKKRGHPVAIATSEFYRSLIEGAGVAFYPVRPDIDPEEILRVVPRIFLDMRKGPEILIREMVLPYLRDSYEDLMAATNGAEALLTHPLTFAGPVVAQKRGIPWISTVLAPLSLFSAYDLPVFPVFPEWMKLHTLGPGVGRFILRFGRWVSRHWVEPVRELRREIGLAPGGDPLYEGQFSPDLNLALFSRVLASPQPDWPPHTKVTGYPLGDGPTPLPSELERFLDSGPAPVVFTLGSSASLAAGSFFREGVEAAKAIETRALLLVGQDPRNALESLPEGIASFDYAPYSQVFPRAAAIVHQGGIGTTGEALRSGRPMLVVPFAFDQPDNASRVERLGVARILYPKRYRAPRVREHLKALLEDPAYAVRAREVSSRVRSEDGVQKACAAIEERLAAMV